MKKARVKVGKYKTVFKGRHFEIKQASALYSNGKKTTFEKACRTPTVIILALNDKKELLLTWEYRLGPKKYMWFLPAGRIDKKGDTPKNAAKRELQEETGYKAKKITLLDSYGSGNAMEYKKYVFLAEGLTYEPVKIDEDEDITVKPLTIDKAMKLVLDGDIEIPEIGFAVITLARYLKNRKKK